MSLLSVFFALQLAHAAPVPPPDQLLAADTLAVITVPDYAKARAQSSQWSGSLLWDDPAMKPFRDKLSAKFNTEIIQPLEKELSLKFADYSGLAQGQVTLAITRNGWGTQPDAEPAFLLLLDARDKSEALKANLATLKKKWIDSGKQIKTEKVRDVEFSTFVINSDDITKTINKVLPDPMEGMERLDAPKPKKAGRTLEWFIGQSDTLLIVGSSAKDIEKILIRQGGGAVPSLSEQTGFAARYANDLRSSLGYGWVNIRAIFDVLSKQIASKTPASPNAPQPDKILAALGLGGIQGATFSLHDLAEGQMFNLFLAVPESSRKGLTKLLAFEAKDAAPPAFVPAEAVKFSRVRLDLSKSLNTLENMLVEAIPQFAGVIKLFVDNAGKDKDPNFDLRQQLIANLGDDLVSFEKSPRKQTLADLQSAPSLVLISSPKAEQLAAAIKALASFLPMQTAKVKERDFLGRKVYAMALPAMPAPGNNKPVERSLSFAASGSYVALSMDPAMLEEYLRSAGSSAKSLRNTPGLAQAAEKVGGMSTGMFGFENQAETTRAAFEILKKESGTIANLLGSTPLGGRLGFQEDSDRFKDWFDFTLLPSFDKIAKYFHISVWSGALSAEGMGIKFFTPTPPAMKK